MQSFISYLSKSFNLILVVMLNTYQKVDSDEKVRIGQTIDRIIFADNAVPFNHQC
ncbi:hypothetical protein MAR_019762 [Mya arenaria]|uniref:Uncharacterized protein n=1 Tax=Mya arenaria TaxID=6604 RepID=A0ABY7E2X3_MYAAR|nr:hypothetical protein MAR_019762 [Mya arenaria]